MPRQGSSRNPTNVPIQISLNESYCIRSYGKLCFESASKLRIAKIAEYDLLLGFADFLAQTTKPDRGNRDL